MILPHAAIGTWSRKRRCWVCIRCGMRVCFIAVNFTDAGGSTVRHRWPWRDWRTWGRS